MKPNYKPFFLRKYKKSKKRISGIFCMKCKKLMGNHKGNMIKWDCCETCKEVAIGEKTLKNKELFESNPEQEAIKKEMRKYLWDLNH